MPMFHPSAPPANLAGRSTARNVETEVMTTQQASTQTKSNKSSGKAKGSETQAQPSETQSTEAKSQAAQSGAYDDAEVPEAAQTGEAAATDEDDMGVEIVQNYTVPEGYKVVSEDVEAYWDIKHGHKPIEFIPRSIRLMDSGRDGGLKSLALVVGVLAAPQMLTRNVRFEKEDRRTRREQTASVQEQFATGTVVGIWAKHGMSELMGFGGVKVWMAPSGQRKLKDRDQPMQLFKVAEAPGQVDAAGEPLIAETLALAGDNRRRSLPEPYLTSRNERTPPWWLEVYPDSGVEMGREAFNKN